MKITTTIYTINLLTVAILCRAYNGGKVYVAGLSTRSHNLLQWAVVLQQ